MALASNVLVTSTVIAKESLRMIENQLGMAKMVYRDWENKFGKDGETLGIRKPNVFRANKNRARQNSTLAESNITLTVATQAHVSFEWSTKQMTDTIERISERYIRPAMSALANLVDVDCYALYVDVSNQVGTAGTAPSGYDVYADARRKLNEEAIPTENRFVNINPKGEAETMKGLKGLLNDKIINDVIIKGHMGSLAGFDMYMAQNVQVHTTGVFTSGNTPAVDGATQTGDTLLTSGWGGSGSATEGDVFTVVDCYAVNPKTGASTGELRQFVVTAATDDNGAAMDIPIYPSMITSGAYQTIVASPGAGELLTFVGVESTPYPMNLAFQKDCFTLAIRPLEIPSSVVWGARESYNGMSIRVIKAYDIDDDKEVLRFDILYGVLCQNPMFGCRMVG